MSLDRSPIGFAAFLASTRAREVDAGPIGGPVPNTVGSVWSPGVSLHRDVGWFGSAPAPFRASAAVRGR